MSKNYIWKINQISSERMAEQKFLFKTMWNFAVHFQQLPSKTTNLLSMHLQRGAMWRPVWDQMEVNREAKKYEHYLTLQGI
jgi:hypothetical protein